MGCRCGASKKVLTQDPMDIMGGYKYLKPHQIKARLEIFKRDNCQSCATRYNCDYSLFLGCKGKQRPDMKV